ncbi:MAG: hypothetical protein HC905_10245 [Bacteroidales bacterium]|nr:hypothetical protein [Bacteroidales bacterium]
MAAILEESQCGQIAGFNEVSRLKNILLQNFNLYLENKLEVNAGNIQAYSRFELTRKLSHILNSIA